MISCMIGCSLKKVESLKKRRKKGWELSKTGWCLRRLSQVRTEVNNRLSKIGRWIGRGEKVFFSEFARKMFN